MIKTFCRIPIITKEKGKKRREKRKESMTIDIESVIL